jgi:hypothetical protein
MPRQTGGLSLLERADILAGCAVNSAFPFFGWSVARANRAFSQPPRAESFPLRSKKGVI